jgi:hypothetical protein
MRHLLGKTSLPHAELKKMFDSPDVQEYLSQNAKPVPGPDPFLRRFVSNDDPDEILAVAWVFSGWDDAIITWLVFDDVLYCPDI